MCEAQSTVPNLRGKVLRAETQSTMGWLRWRSTGSERKVLHVYRASMDYYRALRFAVKRGKKEDQVKKHYRGLPSMISTSFLGTKIDVNYWAHGGVLLTTGANLLVEFQTVGVDRKPRRLQGKKSQHTLMDLQPKGMTSSLRNTVETRLHMITFG